MDGKLVVVEGRGRGAELPFGAKPLLELGSGPLADLPIDDPEVARSHLKLHREQGEVTAFDLSGRGFLHNARRALKAILKHGDVIQVGSTRLRFEQQGVAPPAGRETVRYGEGSRPEAPRPAPPVPSAPPAPPPPPELLASDSDDELAIAPPGPRPARPASDSQEVVHDGRERAYLLCTRGNDAGKTFELERRDTFVLGRGVATDMTVWDIRASRIHCRIDRDDQGLTLVDLNSANGTYVNGRKIDATRLRTGDEIKIGATVLKVVLPT